MAETQGVEAVFQSTPSTRRETSYCIPSLVLFAFQSTPSTRRETTSYPSRRFGVNFNPLPPHGGRQKYKVEKSTQIRISIHSLHTEGDLSTHVVLPAHGISIHSLHTEGDLLFDNAFFLCIHFNPLPPHGGRPHISSSLSQSSSISIHSLHTEGDVLVRAIPDILRISIHSLHTEGDRGIRHIYSIKQHFNPLPPHGGRHFELTMPTERAEISIHSLHTEGDARKD